MDAINDNVGTAQSPLATEDQPLVISVGTLLTNDVDPNPNDANPLTITGVTNGTFGTASFNATTGQITFTPAKDFSGAATFTYSATDGRNSTDVATVTVAVAPVNDAPVLSNVSVRSTYTEGGAPVAIASGLTLSDVDDTYIEEAGVGFTNGNPGGFVPGEDQLNFVNQNGITGSFQDRALTLSGTATVAQYEAALRSVTYSNLSANPTEGRNILISFMANDGEAWSEGQPASSIEVVAVDDPPPPTSTSQFGVYPYFTDASGTRSVMGAEEGGIISFYIQKLDYGTVSNPITEDARFVVLNVGGSASSDDFLAGSFPREVTIPKGGAGIYQEIHTVDDRLAEGNETLSIQVRELNADGSYGAVVWDPQLNLSWPGLPGPTGNTLTFPILDNDSAPMV